MGLLDIFKATENNRLKEEVQSLKIEVDRLTNLVKPEHSVLGSLKDEIKKVENDIRFKNESLNQAKIELDSINLKIEQQKEKLIQVDERVLLQEFGLYTPMYNFAQSYQYKDKLDRLRQEQKDMIKNKTATDATEWTVDGNVAKGRKMTNDNIKQILRSFNLECENAIDKTTFANIESMRKRINTSFDSLNKINTSSKVSIRNEYLDLKLKELYLAYEYQEKKKLEKEEQKEIRLRMKEEAELQKEIEVQRKKLDKELKHYDKALESVNKQILSVSDDNQRLEYEHKKLEMLKKIEEINISLTVVDNREQNQRAGYVYVISNIGSFGENRYKIGMTRRLEPMDRVDELGNASVPFNFDVHALIFSEDAPKLESALHRAFENKKVNMVNKRREFFDVQLEEIETVIKANFDKTVEFTRTAKAEQYRESLRIKESMFVAS
ncbi:MAG: DUF4041 domain-containing protein [Sarcina sp.]